MAFIRNPTIIRDGLVFAFDLWDKDTCYKGRPTTNSLWNSTMSNYNNVGGDVTTNLTLTNEFYKGYQVYKQVITPVTATGVSYLKNGNNPGIGVVTGGGGGLANRYTGHSIFYKPTSLMHTTPIFLAYSNIGGWQCNECAPENMGDGWFRAKVVWYSTSTLSDGKYWAINPADAVLNSPITFYWAGPFKEDLNISDYTNMSPYVYDNSGVRSSTTGLIDVTGNRSITINNALSMSALNPQFDATSYLITDNSSILNNDVHSIFFSVRFNSTGTYPNSFTGAWDKIFTFNPSGSDRSPGVWRYPSQRYIHWRYDPSNSGCDFGKNTSNQDFDLNTWYYVGVTKNGATATCYVNGVYANQATVSNPKTSGNASMWFFEGHTASDITNVNCCHIYNRVLSATEVANNYNAIRGRFGG
jgi:hypothetical protein